MHQITVVALLCPSMLEILKEEKLSLTMYQQEYFVVQGKFIVFRLA